MYEKVKLGRYRKKGAGAEIAPLLTVNFQLVSMVTQEGPDPLSRAGS